MMGDEVNGASIQLQIHTAITEIRNHFVMVFSSMLTSATDSFSDLSQITLCHCFRGR